ncbi:MAG: hypothetical protein NUV75_08260 [Gallionella sp.]|nr:hypothetical protein [Gallionella sp.]
MMEQRPRFQLNRAAIVLRLKQPYVDWARLAGPDPLSDYSLVDANDDGEIFLIPSFDSTVDPVDGTEDAIKWVEKRWKMFFEYFSTRGFRTNPHGLKSEPEDVP